MDANTDGPDGVHTMGAAVRGLDGRMFAGILLAHFTGGPCADRSHSAGPAPKERANSPQSWP